MQRNLFLIALMTALLGCRTTEYERPIHSTDVVRVGKPAEAWEVLDDRGESVGLVVLFRSTSSHESIYMVRNLWHQDLGRIDMRGRAFRYVPHAAEPAWVGTGTLEGGVERILQSSACQLFPIPFETPSTEATPGELELRRADGYGFPAPGA